MAANHLIEAPILGIMVIIPHSFQSCLKVNLQHSFKKECHSEKYIQVLYIVNQ